MNGDWIFSLLFIVYKYKFELDGIVIAPMFFCRIAFVETVDVCASDGVFVVLSKCCLDTREAKLSNLLVGISDVTERGGAHACPLKPSFGLLFAGIQVTDLGLPLNSGG